MAPGWARWSIGDLVDGNRDGMADDTKFDIFALPGVDGGVAPVFAGGSNIAISAQTQNPMFAEALMCLIFSSEYQTLLGETGLGPANSDYVAAMGSDKFATTMIETAQASKLTPASPGWAAVENALLMEKLFERVASGEDVATVTADIDSQLTPMLNVSGTVPAGDAPTDGLDGCDFAQLPDGAGINLTMWVAGGDTPQDLRDWLISEFNTQTGATLTIEEQAWPDLITQLTTALPDANNTPDVVEVGNTQAPTFTAVGAFRQISPGLLEALGGDKLLPSFVEAGTFDGAVFALPYYFGSRYMFFRADKWDAAGLSVPTTLQEFSDAAAALRTTEMSGFAIGGQDWRNGISWIFANGGEIATVDGTTWTSALSSPETIAGLTMWQELFTSSSNLPVTDRDVAYWDFINDQS
jgi:ABC-type glycerol-3-phosphate transport system substrate-binding protein